MRLPSLALDAARWAYESSRPNPQAEFAASYAPALFQIDRLDRAIALQREASEISHGDEKKTHQAILDYYETCEKLFDELRG